MGRIDDAWKRFSNTTSGPSVAPTPDPHVRNSALSQYPLERRSPLGPEPAEPALPVFLTRDAVPEAAPRVVIPAPQAVVPRTVAASPNQPVPIAPPQSPHHTTAAPLQPAAPAVTADAHPPTPVVAPLSPLPTTVAVERADPSARIVAVLQDAHASTGLRTVMVTGAGSHDDNTAVAGMLARGLSEILPRVLLIDTDPESPALQRAIGMRLDADGPAWQHTRWQSLPICEVTPHLSVLTTERLVAQGGFTSDRIAAVLDNCSMFDFVVLCTPPVSSLPDAAQLARRAGAVVFVLSAHAPFSINERCMTQVGRALIVATVLKGVPGEQPDTHTETDTAPAAASTARSARPGAR